MSFQRTFPFLQGNSLSELFAQDTQANGYALVLNYPATASWAAQHSGIYSSVLAKVVAGRDLTNSHDSDRRELVSYR